ncbi:MAG: DUF3313 family protein, partial [Methylovulum sp.]|nr:DUF3313 family protein [Methylovulum sp.]
MIRTPPSLPVSPLKTALILLGVLALAACASQETTHTGFLSHYEQLQPIKDNSRDRVFKGQQMSKYVAFMVDDPVYIPGAKSDKDVSDIDLAEIKAAFRVAAIEAFSERFHYTTEPGAYVLRVKLAITGINRPVYLFKIKNLFVMAPVSNGGASSESEVVDSVTGQRLAALATYTNANPIQGGVLGYFTRYGHAKSVLAGQAEKVLAI